jgi:hypothetical protein
MEQLTDLCLIDSLSLFIFICELFKDAVSSSNYAESNRMINELKRIRDEAAIIYLRHYSDTYLKRLRKTSKMSVGLGGVPDLHQSSPYHPTLFL